MPQIVPCSQLEFKLYSGPEKSCKVCNEKRTNGYICRNLVANPFKNWWYKLTKRPEIFICDPICIVIFKKDPSNDFFIEVAVNGSKGGNKVPYCTNCKLPIDAKTLFCKRDNCPHQQN